VDVRRHPAGVIERADTNEANGVTENAFEEDQVVAPDSHLALRATRDFLVLAAGRRHRDFNDIALEQVDPVGFDQCVHCKCRPVLTLAPAAMAAVDNERLRLHPVTHMTAGATALVNVRIIWHGHSCFRSAFVRGAISSSVSRRNCAA
jgi:hypothetical protein